MAFYSEDLVEEVRSRNDIVDVISGYVSLKKKGSSYFGLCPFHSEKSPSFSVSPGKQMYYCFGCGAGGNVFTFVMEYENYSFQEALTNLADRAGVSLPAPDMSAEGKKQSDYKSLLLEINKEAAKYFYFQLHSEKGKDAYQYFLDRQLTADTIKQFGLGYSNKYSNDLYQYLKKLGYSDEVLKDSGLVSLHDTKGFYDKFWNRAMFPIMDVNNRVIGFGGRVMGEGEPKYLNSPETKIFDKSRNLYGLNIARTSRKKQILICEGYMDVIALHQAGFTNSVASLGTAFTQGHAGLLKRYIQDVVLTYDSDEAGAKAALRAIPILKEAGIRVKVLNMKPYKDPDEFIKELGAEEFQKRIDQATNGFLYEIEVLEKEFDLKDPEGKTRFYNEIARKLLEFEEELERNNYIESIAQKYQIGFENLRKLVHHLAIQSEMSGVKAKPKSGVHKEAKAVNGMKQSQKLMLTWLIEDLSLYPKVRKYISADDFTEDVYEVVAQKLFQQLEEGELNPAKIISGFIGEEEQREAASIFNASLKQIQTKAEMDKALIETILRIKQNSIEERSKKLEPTDMVGLQQLIQDKKLLLEIEKQEISFEHIKDNDMEG